MSTSVIDNESYLDQSPSICQLLRVAKRKLQDPAFGGRFVCSVPMSTVNEILKTESYRVATTLNEAEVKQGRGGESTGLGWLTVSCF